MSILQSDENSSGRYVFVPEMPTPNGRLHLGHMSGPYLRADILARFLRSRGAEAYIVSGSDVYESHVELKSQQTGLSIPEICNDFHRKIRAELDALGITCELYVNPLDPELAEPYAALNRKTIDDLRDRGAAFRVEERVLYSPSQQRYVAGCWMSGQCPSCGVKSGSYLCEECGTQYDPQDVRHVAVPRDLADARQVGVDSWFLKVRKKDELWKQIAKMGIEPDFVRIVERYFSERGDRVRLTNPGRWGMPYVAPDQVIFTYTALFSFSVFCGQLLAARRGWSAHPFALDSDCTTIAGFGIDNAIPYLVGVLGSAIELGTVRPFDHFLTNHFYQLEGKKFSTSRRHLVCATDLVDNGVSADALRYYLAKVNPEKGKRSFVPGEFTACHNEHLHANLGARVGAALVEATQARIGTIPDALAARLRECSRAQSLDLALPRPNLERAVSSVDQWDLLGVTLGVGASSRPAEVRATTAYWWLKGLALLTWPFMPGMSQEIWRRLGHSGEPRPHAIEQSTSPEPQAEGWNPFPTVSREHIEAAVSREGGGG